MLKPKHLILLCLVAALSLFSAALSAAQETSFAAPATERPTPLTIGEHIETSISLNALNESIATVHHAGAEYVKVHLRDVKFLSDRATITVSSPDGLESYTYPGAGYTLSPEDDGVSSFWAISITGDTAVVTLNAAPGIELSAHIDRYARGFSQAEINEANPESTCGSGNERTDVICFQAGHPTQYDESAAVARLVKNGNAHCTGWRVTSGNFLFTNEHCITDQTELDQMEFWFNYQRPTCGSGSVPTAQIVKVTGNTFLLDNTTYDFALVTLDNFSTIQSFGYMLIDPTLPTVGTQIYIPQHGAGNPKEFGITSDVDTGGVCRIVASPTAGNTATSDIGYYCDTIGGSSGSPVLNYSTNRVIGLHHFGTGAAPNCNTGSGNMNRAARMDLIQPLVASYLDADNDNFPGLTITTNMVNYSQDVSLATVQTNDPVFTCAGSVQRFKTVWFNFNLSYNATVTVETLGSDYDTVLGVFTGTHGSMTQIACDDDESTQSRVTFNAVAGTTYYINVAAYSSNPSTSNLVLNVTIPSHDRFDYRKTITAPLGTSGFTETVNVTRALNNLDNPTTTCFSDSTQTVWYSYTPQVSGWFVANNEGSGNDSILAVFTGTSGNFTEIACDDDYTSNGDPDNNETIEVWLNAGTTYHFMNGDYGVSNGATTINFELDALPASAPTPYTPTGTITELNPTYVWDDMGTGSSKYSLYINGTTNYGNTVSNIFWQDVLLSDPNLDCDGQLCSYTPDLPLEVGDHEFYVQAYNDYGYGNWSNAHLFVVSAAPQTPNAYAPSGWITDTTPDFVMGLYPHNHWHRVWLNSMTDVIFDSWYWTGDLTCDLIQCWFTSPVTLNPGLHQFWTQSWNTVAGYSAWSGTSYFGVALIPTQPAAIAPFGTISDNTPTFSWEWDQNDHWYYLWVAGGSYSSDVWHNAFSICSGVTCEVTPGTVLADGSYTWWLQAWSPAGYGPWNAGMGFTVDSTPAVTTAPGVEIAPVIAPANVEVEPIQIELP